MCARHVASVLSAASAATALLLLALAVGPEPAVGAAAPAAGGVVEPITLSLTALSAAP